MIRRVTVEVANASDEQVREELEEIASRLGVGEIVDVKFFPNGDDSPRHLWYCGRAIIQERGE